MRQNINWSTPCGRFEIFLTAKAWQQMDLECERTGEIETGGILVGYYTSNGLKAVITEALPPPTDSNQSRSWFHRGIAGLGRLLAQRWENHVRSYYVGEWHYHPATIVEPSAQDIDQMNNINSDPQYCCREPIMLIIGMPQTRGQRPIRAFVFPKSMPFVEF